MKNLNLFHQEYSWNMLSVYVFKLKDTDAICHKWHKLCIIIMENVNGILLIIVIFLFFFDYWKIRDWRSHDWCCNRLHSRKNTIKHFKKIGSNYLKNLLIHNVYRIYCSINKLNIINYFFWYFINFSSCEYKMRWKK